MARPLTVRLDRDLERDLRRWARANGLTPAQAMRELVRQALGDADPISRAWKEAFVVAYRDLQLTAPAD